VWNIKATIMAAIMATGTVPKSFRKHLNNISERHR
jgi:hypothetical protein